MQALLISYNNSIVAHPIITKCITSMILNSISDILSQIITSNKKDRILRNIRFMIWGLLFGVVAHYYLVLSSNIFTNKSIFCTILKLVVDQLVWTPFANGLFFIVISCLEHPHNQPQEAINSVRKNIWKTQKLNMMLWIPVQFINFTFVPVDYQLFVINIVNVFWTCYLNMVATRTSLYKSLDENKVDV